MSVIKNLSAKFDSDFKELIKHAKNYVTADVFAKGLVFLSIPVLTRLLGVEDYGVLGVFNSISAILIILFGLGIRGSVTRYFYEDSNDFDSFLGSNVILLTIFGLGLGSILYLYKEKLSAYFETSSSVFSFAILIAFLSAMYEIYLAYLQASKQSKEYSVLSILKSLFILSFTIGIILLLERNKYFGQIYAQLIVITVISGYALYRILAISKVNLSKKYLRYSLFFGIPVVFHLISQSVLSSFDQIIINQLVGEKETGLYSFAYQIGFIQSIISMGVLKSWTPIFYEKKKISSHDSIENLAKKYSIIVYMLALCLMLFSYEIIYIMSDEKFHSSQDIVPIVVLSYVFFFLYTLYVGYSFFHKKTYLIAIFSLVTGSLNVYLNYLLIPEYGYKAAAYTTLISYAVLFILHYFNVKFLVRERQMIRLIALLPNLLIIVLAYLIYIWVHPYISYYLLDLLLKIGLVGIVFVYFLKRKMFA